MAPSVSSRRRKARRTTGLVCTFAALALAVTTFLLREHLRGEWHLYQLNGDGASAMTAARALGKAGSLRAVPGLLAHLDTAEMRRFGRSRGWFNQGRGVMWSWADDEFRTLEQLGELFPKSPYYEALLQIHRQHGPALIPALVDALRQPGFIRRYVALRLLTDLGASAHPAIPAVRALVESDTFINMRRTAARALEKISAPPLR